MIDPRPVRLEWLLIIAMLAVVSPASAAGIHQHGQAEAAVVVEGDELMVTFRAPLMDILGTESAPVDAPARVRYDNQLARVVPPEPSAEADCELVHSTVSTVETLFPTTGSVEAGHDHDHDHDHDQHQDVENEWTFSCGSPAGLRTVILPFLQTFSRLTTEVVLLLPQGQSALKLSPGETRIPLE